MNLHQNLLPVSCRRKLVLRHGLRVWGVALLLTALASGAVCSVKYALLRASQQTLADLETSAQPLHELRRQTGRIENQLAVLNRRESLLSALEKASRPLKLLAIISQSAAVNTGKLRITDLELETTAASPAGPRRQMTPRARIANRSSYS